MSKYIFNGPKSDKDKTVAISYNGKDFRVGDTVELSDTEYGEISVRFDFTKVGDFSPEPVIEEPPIEETVIEEPIIVNSETLGDSESAKVDSFVGFNTVNDEEDAESSSFFNKKPTKNKEVK